MKDYYINLMLKEQMMLSLQEILTKQKYNVIKFNFMVNF